MSRLRHMFWGHVIMLAMLAPFIILALVVS